MKLLLDENLSRRIVPFPQADFTGSSQVVPEGLERASDVQVWEHARGNDFIIVIKDSDFYELSLLQGTPPKVIWLRIGNASKSRVVQVLLEHRQSIQRLLAERDIACLEIG